MESPRCPWCGEQRLVERVGGVWYCAVCALSWTVSVAGKWWRVAVTRA